MCYNGYEIGCSRRTQLGSSTQRSDVWNENGATLSVTVDRPAFKFCCNFEIIFFLYSTFGLKSFFYYSPIPYVL